VTALDGYTRAQLLEHLGDLNRALTEADAVILIPLYLTDTMSDADLRDAIVGTASHLGRVVRGAS
jgi:hypothetical protein